MTVQKSHLSLAWIAALMVATPTLAQMPFVPDYALPRAGDSPSTYVAGGYARGVNDDAGKTDVFGASVGRSTGRVSYQSGVGYALGAADKLLLGAALGIHFLDAGNPMQLGLQAGFGWVDQSTGAGTFRIPVGIALSRRSSGPTQVTSWIMPRLNIQRQERFGLRDTDYDFGTSAGVSVTSESGLGVNVALDVVFTDSVVGLGPVDIKPILFSIGMHYVLGS